jgi:hypothetical protein
VDKLIGGQGSGLNRQSETDRQQQVLQTGKHIDGQREREREGDGLFQTYVCLVLFGKTISEENN